MYPFILQFKNVFFYLPIVFHWMFQLCIRFHKTLFLFVLSLAESSGQGWTTPGEAHLFCRPDSGLPAVFLAWCRILSRPRTALMAWGWPAVPWTYCTHLLDTLVRIRQGPMGAFIIPLINPDLPEKYVMDIKAFMGYFKIISIECGVTITSLGHWATIGTLVESLRVISDLLFFPLRSPKIFVLNLLVAVCLKGGKSITQQNRWLERITKTIKQYKWIGEYVRIWCRR